MSPDENNARSSERLPHLGFNWLTAVGVALVACGLTGGLFLIFLDVIASPRSYFISLTFLPPLGLALLGALLIPIGILRERRRRNRGARPSFEGQWRVDLAALARGRWPTVFVGGTVAVSLAVLIVGAVSLRAIEFSESDAFCGGACHEIMGPEASTHERSPHARIHCVDCHVGEGADPFIRAKLSGLLQLYASLTHSFSSPIETPIVRRRPSAEMCESCHWRDRLIEYKVLTRSYYLSDADNTELSIRLMVKVGGSERASGAAWDP